MSILNETITTVKESAGNHGGAGSAKWRSRVIATLSLIVLIAAAGYGLRLSGAVDVGKIVGQTSTDQSEQTWAVPATVDAEAMHTPPAMGNAGSSTASDVDEVTVAGSITDDIVTAQLSETGSGATGTSSNSTASTQRSLSAVAGVDGANLLDSPGGTLLSSIDVGERLFLQGRSDNSAWLLASASGATGWVSGAEIIGFNLDSLPVLSVQGVVRAATDNSSTVAQPADRAASQSAADGADVATFAAELDAGTDEVVESEAVSAIATVTLDDGRLNIRSGPGTEYEILAKAYSGEEYYALGRDSTSDWIMVLVNGDEVGWLSAQYINLSQEADSLPVAPVDTATSVLAVSQGQQAEPPAASTQANANQDTALLGAVSFVSTQAVSAADTDLTNAPPSSVTALQGTLVFEESNGGAIYAVDLETGVMTYLTYGADPAVSPDGSTIAFVRDGGENGLYLVDVDGSNERVIWSGRSGLSSPSWSPDGNWIVFSFRGDYDECWQVGRMCLPENPGSDDAQLVRTYSYNLAIVDVNGGSYHEPPSLNSAVAPDWNDAGIVYQSDAGIQLTNDDAGGVNQLVSYNYLKPTYQDPALQPNGDLIVFQSREGGHYEIFTMNTVGSDVQALTKPKTTLVDEIPSNVSPAWSPDGQSIVFLSNRTDDGSAGEWQLWIMDADGGNQRPLGIDAAIDYAYGAEQVMSWAFNDA